VGKTTTKKSNVKKILKRDLVSNRKYKTTFKDINKYFKIINKAVFKNVLQDFVDTLGHEMVHLYQMANVGDTGNHNKLFYSFRPKLNAIGLDL